MRRLPLFPGVSMAVTTFPVLARTLSDRNMTRSEPGAIALACAAADDITAWCLLAFVVGVVKASMTEAAVNLGLAAVYVGVIFVVVRPVVVRYLSPAFPRTSELRGTQPDEPSVGSSRRSARSTRRTVP